MIALLLPAALLVLPGCQKDVKEPDVAASGVEALAKGGMSASLKAVRNATARYHSTALAQSAGYMPNEHCVPNMGYHWANPNLIDAEFNPVQPEVMLYAKGPGGNLRLVAVEYVVLNQGQQRPSFEGHLFDIGGTPVPAPHWSMHVWLYEENPSGMFVPFNPNVSCQ